MDELDVGPKMKTLKNTGFAILLTITAVGCKDTPFVQAGQQQATPSWKHARPQPESYIQPGDKVYIFTNIFPDPFDGIFQVSQKGMVSPRYCGAPVKIGGYSEVMASTIVLEHACKHDVYNERSNIRIYVVRVDRFQSKNEENGQQGETRNPH